MESWHVYQDVTDTVDVCVAESAGVNTDAASGGVVVPSEEGPNLLPVSAGVEPRASWIAIQRVLIGSDQEVWDAVLIHVAEYIETRPFGIHVSVRIVLCV